MYYLQGTLFTWPSPQDALSWFKQAAAQKSKAAIEKLFDIYTTSKYGLKNLDEAEKLLKEITDEISLNPQSFNNTPLVVVNFPRPVDLQPTNIGFWASRIKKKLNKKDMLLTERETLLKFAQEENSTPQVKYNLAMHYLEGKLERLTGEVKRSKKNIEEAEKWLRKAVEEGLIEAKEMLGTLGNYYEHQGFLKEAEEYYKDAAAKGNTIAKEKLVRLKDYEKNRTHANYAFLPSIVKMRHTLISVGATNKKNLRESTIKLPVLKESQLFPPPSFLPSPSEMKIICAFDSYPISVNTLLKTRLLTELPMEKNSSPYSLFCISKRLTKDLS